MCIRDRDDLKRRLGNIIIGYRRDRTPVLARDVHAPGPMTALLKDAFMPNLVQTLENNPALVHGGPFANIAHGCNSVVATKTALKLADYVVTEAGFGADLGAEKFLDIKCRKAGLTPDVVVLVATARALKMHGGVAKGDLTSENVGAVEAGLENLGRHLDNITQYGVPVAVAINKFTADTDGELNAISRFCSESGVEVFNCTHWSDGGAGTEALAAHVAELADSGLSQFRPLYEDKLSLWRKLNASPVKYMVRTTSSQTKRFAHNLMNTTKTTGISPCAWRRHNTVFRLIQIYSALRRDIWCQFERFDCRLARNSWW